MALTLTTELTVRNFTLFHNPMLTASQVVEMITSAWNMTLNNTSPEDLPETRQRPAQVDAYVSTALVKH